MKTQVLSCGSFTIHQSISLSCYSRIKQSQELYNNFNLKNSGLHILSSQWTYHIYCYQKHGHSNFSKGKSYVNMAKNNGNETTPPSGET